MYLLAYRTELPMSSYKTCSRDNSRSAYFLWDEVGVLYEPEGLYAAPPLSSLPACSDSSSLKCLIGRYCMCVKSKWAHPCIFFTGWFTSNARPGSSAACRVWDCCFLGQKSVFPTRLGYCAPLFLHWYIDHIRWKFCRIKMHSHKKEALEWLQKPNIIRTQIIDRPQHKNTGRLQLTILISSR
jgi:hypothetical protein